MAEVRVRKTARSYAFTLLRPFAGISSITRARLAVVGVTAAALLFPLVNGNDADIDAAANALAFAALALGLNIVVGFARLIGRSIGMVANQPISLAGVLDINASDKASRFIRFCNAFNIPVVTLVDVPGFLPGLDQEYGGIIRHGAKMIFAYSAATVPKVTVILRKSFGGAYLAMCGRDMGADRVYAWPTAEVAVMGAEGAAEIVFKKEIEAAEDKTAKRQEMINHYREAFETPYVAAAHRLVDDIIEPASTRRVLAQALEFLHTKRELRPPKKHGLIPL